jgi:hypothetical protein
VLAQFRGLRHEQSRERATDVSKSEKYDSVSFYNPQLTFQMKQYHDLLQSILKNGVEHRDRTGVGTISHFGFQTRFDLREGFPIVTTKRVPFRWVAEELFWFLSGDTSEANLRARGSTSGPSGPTKNTPESLAGPQAILVQSMVISGGRLAATIRKRTASIRSRNS